MNPTETVPHTPGPWKNCIPQNQSLMSKSLATPVLHEAFKFTVVSQELHLTIVLTPWIILEQYLPTLNFVLRFYLFILGERGREGEREGEKHHCVVASHAPPTGDLACNLGMYPDWESNQQSFGSRAGIQSTESHQPGPYPEFLTAVYMLMDPKIGLHSIQSCEPYILSVKRIHL